MPINARDWWSKRKFGFTSLALSLAEVAVVYGSVAWVVMTNQPRTLHSIRNLFDFAFLIGGLSSLGFAVAGIVADSHRLMAVIAVVVTIMTFIVCGFQMLV